MRSYAINTLECPHEGEPMNKLYSSLPITGVARSIADIARIEAPKEAGPSIDVICNSAKSVFGDKKANRVFIYNPDVIAL